MVLILADKYYFEYISFKLLKEQHYTLNESFVHINVWFIVLARTSRETLQIVDTVDVIPGYW